MHNLLLGIGSLINNEEDTFRVNGEITYEDAKLMLKCNYLEKKCGFSQSIIKLLHLSSNVVNGGKFSTIMNIGEEKGKKSKISGTGRKRKGEKITFTEDLGDHTTEENFAELNENNNYVDFKKEKVKNKNKKKEKKIL